MIHKRPLKRLAGFKRLASSRIFRAAWFAAALTAAACGLAARPLAILAAIQSSPVVSIDETTYDFGEVFEGEHIFHTFTVRNSGSVPLEIRDPAAKAENPGNEQSARVAAAFETGRGTPGFAGRAAVSELSFHGRPPQTTALYPLVAPRGRPAAPA